MSVNLQAKKGIIFDCDGVIIDSKLANQKFYNLILQELDLPEMSADQEEYVHSHTVQDSVRHIVPEARLQEAWEAARKISYTRVLSYIELQPDIRQLLQSLWAKGLRMAINTNRTGTLELILQRFALEDFFQPVVTPNMVARPKPDPESLFLILKRWGADLDQAVFVGDSAVDAQAAREAGLEFWAYKNPKLQAALHVDSYALLKSYLQI